MSGTRAHDPHELAALAERFATTQDLDRERAGELAARVLDGPDDIARSAVEWARTGTMPLEPEVLGESPQTLSERFEPSQVFTGLILLRSDPHAADRVLRRGVDRASVDRPDARRVQVDEPAERTDHRERIGEWAQRLVPAELVLGATAVVLGVTDTIHADVSIIILALALAALAPLAVRR